MSPEAALTAPGKLSPSKLLLKSNIQYLQGIFPFFNPHFHFTVPDIFVQQKMYQTQNEFSLCPAFSASQQQNRKLSYYRVIR